MPAVQPKSAIPRLPPSNYETLTQAIEKQYDSLSRTFQQIGRYLTQNPNDIAIQSINVLADRCGVHPSSLVRFSQHFGYAGFKELQAIFRARLAIAATGFESRVNALKSELALHKQGDARGPLADLVTRDIASLQDLLSRTTERQINDAVSLMEKAETIYIVGQLRSAPVAVFIRYVLTMLGRKAVLLDANGGLATEMARMMRPKDVLFAISFRFYAKEAVTITELAASAEVPIIALSDSRLSPLAKSATVLFEVPEDEYSFSRSLAAPMCLVQSLLISLAARLEGGLHQKGSRIPILTQPH